VSMLTKFEDDQTMLSYVLDERILVVIEGNQRAQVALIYT
jgi:hypothetical protein